MALESTVLGLPDLVLILKVSTTLLYSHIHIHNTNISRNIINNNDDFNEQMNALLYKNIISHFILERVMLVVCERWAGDGNKLLYWPQVLLTIAALLSHLGWVAQPWVTEGPRPSVCRWVSIQHLVSNWLKPPRAPGYIIVSHPPASTVLPLIYTGASLDWRLGRGSIYNNISKISSTIWLQYYD